MTRRGGILLEVMLSLGLFVTAALFVLGAVRDGVAALDRAHQRQEAVDLARSAMARLESGLINLADLRAGRAEESARGEPLDGEDRADRMELEATSEPFEQRGLTLVELRVRRVDGIDGPPGPVLCVLRQLVRLRDDAGDEAFEEDDLLEGLPDAPDLPIQP